MQLHCAGARNWRADQLHLYRIWLGFVGLYRLRCFDPRTAPIEVGANIHHFTEETQQTWAGVNALHTRFMSDAIYAYLLFCLNSASSKSWILLYMKPVADSAESTRSPVILRDANQLHNHRNHHFNASGFCNMAKYSWVARQRRIPGTYDIRLSRALRTL